MSHIPTRYLSRVLLFLLLSPLGAVPAVSAGDFYWADSDFGVVCDGSTIDTANLQLALDGVAATGGTLVLPNGGDCLYDGQLTISGDRWVLEGNGATLRLHSAATSGGLLVEDSSNLEIRNLSLAATGFTGSSGPNLLTLDRSNLAFLIDVRAVDSPADGIRIESNGAEPPSGLRSHTVELVACSATGSDGDGLRVVEAVKVSILGGSFSNNGSGTTAGHGIHLANEAAGEQVKDVLIQGVTVSGSAGTGITITQAPGSLAEDFTNFRIVDSDLSDSGNGEVQIDAGAAVTVRGNHIHDSSPASPVAILTVTPNAGDVMIMDNIFKNLETGDSALWVDKDSTGPGLVQVVGNQFTNINLVTAPVNNFKAAVLHEGHEPVISENDFFNIGNRSIYTAGARGMISGNTLHQVTENVLLIAGDDSVVINNFIGSLATPSTTSAAGKAAIRLRRPRVTARGNTLICANTLQRGIHIDEGASLVTNNTIDDCAAGNQGDGINLLSPSTNTILIFSNNLQH